MEQKRNYVNIFFEKNMKKPLILLYLGLVNIKSTGYVMSITYVNFLC